MAVGRDFHFGWQVAAPGGRWRTYSTQSSIQPSIQPSTLSSIQSSILPNQPPPRPGVIARSFAEADAAGVIVGPLDGDLDELGAGAREADEGFGTERETARIGGQSGAGRVGVRAFIMAPDGKGQAPSLNQRNPALRVIGADACAAFGFV